MQVLPEGLNALANYKQFILYRLEPMPDGKTAKKPSSTWGGNIDPHEPRNWLTFQEAAQQAQSSGLNVGFVLTAADPFFFIDIDNALQNGRWSDLSNQICQQFAGAAVEISQSGKGLHIIGTGNAPEHRKKNRDYNLEFYTQERFIALTGRDVAGDAHTNHTVALGPFVQAFMQPNANSTSSDEWTTEPVEAWSGPEDDQALIEKMLNSSARSSAFSHKASLVDLWQGNEEKLSVTYPDKFGSRAYDYSDADAALASHLAFWTGGDCERIERLMRMSALVREKWDAHGGYLPMTITGAAGRCTSFYCDRRPETKQNTNTDDGLTGYQFQTIDNQIEYFEGCVYVTDLHEVFTPWGDLLNPARFKARFGGYEFALDKSNQKTTRNAFDAFTESQGHRFPQVDGISFDPLRPTGDLTEEHGRTSVNIYVEIETPRLQGDASPFLVHLAKILPDPHDQSIILAYMAACVQYKGVKFDWCPLVQGVQGNGKTLLTRCVRFAIGSKYTHMPKASKIDSEFNAWLRYAIFVGVEDIFVPGDKQHVIETIKPMITGGDGIEIQKKGVDQTTEETCANFLLNSNHKNALPITKNDRRFCVFFTAQQNKDDLKRDGLTEDYFYKLYEWLKADGYAIVNDFLATYHIPEELNPATKCRRAPDTSTTEQALKEARGAVEQEILEAIEEERPGFGGGWISSLALDRFLVQINAAKRITRNKRTELLEDLGYTPHPGLPGGRTNNVTNTDSGRPRLFITANHPSLVLEKAKDIADAYDSDQTPDQYSALAQEAFGNESNYRN